MPRLQVHDKSLMASVQGVGLGALSRQTTVTGPLCPMVGRPVLLNLTMAMAAGISHPRPTSSALF